jgi:hypothetical protein
MSSDDLNMSTLLMYNRDFNYEMNFCNAECDMKAYKQIYLDGLKPIQLKQMVQVQNKKTINENMKLARQSLPKLREGKALGALFTPTTSIPVKTSVSSIKEQIEQLEIRKKELEEQETKLKKTLDIK